MIVARTHQMWPNVRYASEWLYPNTIFSHVKFPANKAEQPTWTTNCYVFGSLWFYLFLLKLVNKHFKFPAPKFFSHPLQGDDYIPSVSQMLTVATLVNVAKLFIMDLWQVMFFRAGCFIIERYRVGHGFRRLRQSDKLSFLTKCSWSTSM